MTLTEILLLILALGGSFYLGYVFGRRSALVGAPDHDASPLPGPGGVPPMPADVRAEPPRRAAPPPTSAGGAAGGPAPAGQRDLKRTAKPPPARAGLMDTGGKKS